MAERRGAIPEAELEVLAALTRIGEAEASAIREALAAQRPLAHSSVMTLLQRLQRRGLVKRRPAGRGKAFLYDLRRPSSLKNHLRRLASRLFGDDRARSVSTLFEGDPPTAEELAELTRMVDEMTRERGRP